MRGDTYPFKLLRFGNLAQRKVRELHKLRIGRVTIVLRSKWGPSWNASFRPSWLGGKWYISVGWGVFAFYKGDPVPLQEEAREKYASTNHND